MGLPVALQLYSVREQCAADLNDVLRQVADWGYNGVEFAGLHGHQPQAVRDMLDQHQLRCAGAHVALDLFADDAIEQTLADYATLGCPYLIIPWLPENKRNSVDAATRTAQHLAELASAVQPRGFGFGFHAHWDDMTPLETDGGIETSAWYLIGKHTPDSFLLQYDTGNGAAGGADAVQPLKDFPGRAKSLHLKSFVNAQPGQPRETGLGQAAIGEDDLPWDDILHAARGVGGTHWLVVEQEGHANLDPMAAAHASFKGIRRFVKPVTV